MQNPHSTLNCQDASKDASVGKCSSFQRRAKRRRQYGSFVLVRNLKSGGVAYYFRFVVPMHLRTILGIREVRRVFPCNFSFQESQTTAATIVLSINMVFNKITNSLSKGLALDNKRVKNIINQILDFHFENIKNNIMYNIDRQNREEDVDIEIISEMLSEHQNSLFVTNIYQENSNITNNVVKFIKFFLEKGFLYGKLHNSNVKQEEFPVNNENKKIIDGTRCVIRKEKDGLNVVFNVGCNEFTSNKIDSKKDLEDLSRFCSKKERSVTHVISKTVDRLQGRNAKRMVVGELTIKDVIDEYIRESSNKNNDVKTEEERRAAMVLFCEAEDVSKTISQLTPQMMIDFDEILGFLPTRKECKYPGVLASYFRANSKAYVNDEKLSAKTKLKRLAMVRAFVNWMPKRNYCTFDDAKRLSITLSERMKMHKREYEKSGGSTRTSFNMEEMARIFNCETYIKASSKAPERFWLPLLALYTGARTQDLLSLRRCDIKVTPEQPDIARLKCGSVDEDTSREGIPYIDLTDTMEKELKTARSNRVIPIHPFIWDNLGFKNHIQSIEPNQFLFGNQIKANGELSDSFGKWFTRYRRSVGVGRQAGDKSTRDVVFHSFRHTVKRALRLKRCDAGIVHEVIGHDDGSETSVSIGYSGSLMIEQKLDGAIGCLDFEKSINLACLATSEWVKRVVE